MEERGRVAARARWVGNRGGIVCLCGGVNGVEVGAGLKVFGEPQ